MSKHVHTFFNSLLDTKGYAYICAHVAFEVLEADPRFLRMLAKLGYKEAFAAHFRRSRMCLSDGKIFTSLYLKHKHCMVSLSADLPGNQHFAEHVVGDTVVLTRMHADRYSDHSYLFEKHDIAHNGLEVTLCNIDRGNLLVRTPAGQILQVTESQVAHKLPGNVAEELLRRMKLVVTVLDTNFWFSCHACGGELREGEWVTCKGCGAGTYCDRKCASRGWALHKLWCTNVRRNVCAYCLEPFPVDAHRRPQCPCRQVYYCGRRCQKKDWKTHKPSCGN